MKRIILLLLCVCLLLAGCGAAKKAETAPETETTEAPLSMEEYTQLITESSAKIESDALGVGNLALYEVKYLSTLSKISGKTDIPEDTIDKALEWIEKNSDYTKESMEKAYKDNSADYKEIALAKVPEGADKVWELYDTYFTAYMNLHNLAMAPSGGVTTFAANGNDYIQTMTTTKPQLDILLSD